MANIESETYANDEGYIYSIIYRDNKVSSVIAYWERDTNGLPCLADDLTAIKNGQPFPGMDEYSPAFDQMVEDLREEDPDNLDSDAELIAQRLESERDLPGETWYKIATDGRVDWDLIVAEGLSDVLPELDALSEE